MPGKAFGPNRDYQVLCRDVLVHRDRSLQPWAEDGIDIPFDLPDTRWTLDVALRGGDGSLVVAECRRTAGPVKQEDVAAFAYKVELLRKSLQGPVAGSFFTKTHHQIGAVKVGQFSGINVVLLDEGAATPGFNLTFLRYDAGREQTARDVVMHVPSVSYAVDGKRATLVVTRSDGSRDVR